MAKNNINQYRRDEAASLRFIGSILYRSGVCIDPSPINSAADQISYGKDRDLSWSYSISNLTLKISKQPKILPSTAKDFRIDLSVNVSGKINAAPEDYFTKMEIDVEKYVTSSQGKQLRSAWHFDRHIIDIENQDPYITSDIHPLYHFQFGGNKIKGIADRLGDTFFVDPPRLMHPPLDGILAIDFILANYDGDVWKKLHDDGQYRNLVNSRLAKLWEPFFSSVAKSWQSPRDNFSRFLCPTVKD